MSNNSFINTALNAQSRSYANLPLGRVKNLSKPRIDYHHLPILIGALFKGASIPELESKTNLSRKSLGRFISSIRKYLRIVDYIPSRGYNHPVYELTYPPGKDIPPPEKLSDKERAKRYRDKQKAIKFINIFGAKSK